MKTHYLLLLLCSCPALAADFKPFTGEFFLSEEQCSLATVNMMSGELKVAPVADRMIRCVDVNELNLSCEVFDAKGKLPLKVKLHAGVIDSWGVVKDHNGSLEVIITMSTQKFISRQKIVQPDGRIHAARTCGGKLLYKKEVDALRKQLRSKKEEMI